MKSKLFYLLLIPLFSFAFQSCKDKDDNSSAYAEWRAKNEAHIEDIRNNPAYRATIEPQGGPGVVYYKIDKSGNGKRPLDTDRVKVRYEGFLINSDKPFDDASNRIVEFAVNGVVPGFRVALQNMKEGDKWEVHIPWQLGYGAQGSSPKIPPYSALIFKIELVEVILSK